jgi:hypothetical protein
MTEPWVFLYGSYMSPAVLADLGVTPTAWEPACAPGLILRIRPKANLERSDTSSTWGVNAMLGHGELARLYADDAPALDGHPYLPHAIMTHTVAGAWRPALTYICASLADAAPDPIYVRRIAAAARAHGLPAHHVKWIESTAPIPARALLGEGRWPGPRRRGEDPET